MEDKLIEAVRRRKLLYDTNHSDYPKSKLKYQVWNEVAREVGIKNGAEAKNLWEKLRHSLRDAFRRQLKNGSSASNTKPWKYQQQMSFLQPYMTNRKREANSNDRSEDELSTTQNLEETGECVKPDKEECVIKDESRGTNEAICTEVEDSTTRPTKRTKKDQLLRQRSLPIRKEIFTKRKNVSRKSLGNSKALYHFFKSMYETTKIMPLSSQYVLKNTIYEAVANMEASLLDIDQSSEVKTIENSMETNQFFSDGYRSHSTEHFYNGYTSTSNSPSTSSSQTSEN